MANLSIYLMREKPEMWVGEQADVLEDMPPKICELFVLVVLHIRDNKSLASADLDPILYGDQTDRPASNVIDRYMSKMYQALQAQGVYCPDKEAFKQCVEGARLDVKDFNTAVMAILSLTGADAEEVARTLERGIALYLRGFLPNWNRAWLQGEQESLRKQYHLLWTKAAEMLRKAGKNREIIAMITNTLTEYHTDPASETHQVLQEQLRLEQEKPPSPADQGESAAPTEEKQSGKTVNIKSRAKKIKQIYNL